MQDDLPSHNAAMGGDGVILLDGQADGAVDGLVGQLENMDVDPPPPLVGEEGGWNIINLKVQGQVFPLLALSFTRATQPRYSSAAAVKSTDFVFETFATPL